MITIAKNKVFPIFDIVLPWQSFSALFWFFSGVLLNASGAVRNFDSTIIVVLIALLSARSAGMCINRICDRQFDAKNPRTQNRTLPAGKITVREVVIYTFVLCVIFSGACYVLPFIGRIIGAFVGFLLLLYSYTKRFTYLCHFVLGIIHGIIPIVGSLWATQTCTLASLFLGAGALFSITGTDIIYSLLDEEFDRSVNLKSIPARFGRKNAIICSFLLHMISLIFIAAAFFLTSASCAFFIWSTLSCFLCVSWYFFLKDMYILKHTEKFQFFRVFKYDVSSYFPYFLLFFSGGSLFSLGVDYLWRTLL